MTNTRWLGCRRQVVKSDLKLNSVISNATATQIERVHQPEMPVRVALETGVENNLNLEFERPGSFCERENVHTRMWESELEGEQERIVLRSIDAHVTARLEKVLESSAIAMRNTDLKHA